MHFDVTYVLAAGESNYTDSLVSFAWIMAVALLAPLVSHLTGKKMPAVALLIFFGMIIGPSMLGLAHEDPGIGMLRNWASARCSCWQVSKSTLLR